jgi:RNA polymerase sigma-32 factor
MGQTLSIDAGLSRYLTEVSKFPLLTSQEEFDLAIRWREQRDRNAAYRLVTSHLRLVAKIAMRYRGYGLPVADIVSEGNVGLMRAVKRFEPAKGFRLATYAMWWIKASIQEYILRSWSLVKLGSGKNQKRLFFRLRQSKNKISALESHLNADQVKLLAERIGVREHEVVEMNCRLDGDLSLHVPSNDDNDSGEWQDWLVDPGPDPENMTADREENDLRRRALHEALKTLNDRERYIFHARKLVDEPSTLEDLAVKFGVSRERVRQIEVRALEKVTSNIQERLSRSPVPAASGLPPTPDITLHRSN